MRAAALQTPYFPFGSFEAVDYIAERLLECQRASVDILCCPESVLGGVAHESIGQSPADVAIRVDNGDLAALVRPLLQSSVSVIVGFTERDTADKLYSSAALLADGGVAGVYRKVFPGYRTAIQPGDKLPVFSSGIARIGIIICNDVWYVEPARILAASGAAVVFIPSNGGHFRDWQTAGSGRVRGDNLAIARAVENGVTVVVADVAGEQGDRCSIGCSAIIEPDGRMLSQHLSAVDGLLIADVEPQRRQHNDPRGFDGYTNPAVTDAFRRLWDGPIELTDGDLRVAS